MMIGYNFSERLRKVFAYARDEAVRLGHEYVGSEHLLLALLREGAGGCATVLRHLDIAPEQVRQRLDEIIVPGPGLPTGPDLPYTSRAKKVLELAMVEALRSHATVVDTEQLLVGLCAEEKGIAAQVLAGAGLTTDVARAAVDQLSGTPAEPVRASPDATDIVAVRIEVERADGSLQRELFPGVAAAMAYLANQRR
jgi:ATP-dependent Clp protease ATP-binding subunit ClpC